MPAKLFVDTNILVYLANENAQLHQAVLKQVEAFAASHAMVISRQVLREYAVVMTRPGIVETPLTPDELAEDLEKWQRVFEVVDETQEVTAQLVCLLKKYQLKGKRIHDANIAATMLAYGISELWTADVEDFQKFEEIRIIGIEESRQAA